MKMGDDTPRCIKGSGTIQIKTYDGMVRSLDCWYVLDLQKNLISLGLLAKRGLKYYGEGEYVKVSKGSLLIMKGKMNNTNMYFLEGNSVKGTVVVSQSLDRFVDKTELWHRRLGHMSEKGLSVLSKQGLLDDDVTGKMKFCEACVKGKQRRVSFGVGIHTSKEVLEYVHSDLWGPSPVKSWRIHLFCYVYR